MAMVGMMIFNPIPPNAWCWTGSSGQVGLNIPDSITDTSTIRPYFGVLGWTWNNLNAVDYIEVWTMEDTDNDTIIDQSEINNRQAYRLENFNKNAVYNQRLVPRSFFHGISGSKQFMYIYGKDINGATSTDTNIAGLGPNGDATRGDSCIAYFTIQ